MKDLIGRENLHMRPLIAVLAIMLCLICPVDSALAWWWQKEPDVKRAIKKIESYQNSLENFREKLDNSLMGEAAKETIKKYFKQEGIQWSMQYVDSWGGRLSQVYHWVNDKGPRGYITRHIKKLEGSIDIIKNKGYADRSQMKYLHKGVQEWQEKAAELQRLFFKGYLPLSAQLAKVLEEENELNSRIYELSSRIISSKMEKNEFLSADLERRKKRLEGHLASLTEEEKKVGTQRDGFVDKMNALTAKDVFNCLGSAKVMPQGEEFKDLDIKDKPKYIKEKTKKDVPEKYTSPKLWGKGCTRQRLQQPFTTNDDYGRPQVWLDLDGDGFLDSARTYDYDGEPLYEIQYGPPEIGGQRRVRVYEEGQAYTEFIDSDLDGVMDRRIKVDNKGNKRESQVSEMIVVDPDYGTFSIYSQIDEEGIPRIWEHFDSRGNLRERSTFDDEYSPTVRAWDANGSPAEPNTWFPAREWRETARERFSQATGLEGNPSAHGGGGAEYEWDVGPDGVPRPKGR